MKTKRAFLNISTNLISKFLTVLLAILIPKLYIDSFGSEVNGLISSITGIFVYINLLEAGIGAASIQALYRPISKKNLKEINSILTSTNRFYKRAGLYFLACVSIVAFLYPLAISSEIPFKTIVLIIIITAIPSALNLFFQGKYIVLLNADNKVYILTTINMLINLSSNIARIILLINGFDILLVQSVFSILSLIQLLIIFIYIRKTYPQLNFNDIPNDEAISQKNSVVIHQIAGVIFANTDVLLISFFCGLKEVSVYTIYNLIFIQAGFLPSILSSSLTAGFGQLYFENKKKFLRLYNFFEVYYIPFAFSILSITYFLILPFLKIYTLGVSDINYIDPKLALLFLIINLLSFMRWPGVIVISITGHFQQTKRSAIIEMLLNLIVSIYLILQIGIYGVLVGSIIALLYRTLYILFYINKYILIRNNIVTLKRITINIILLVLTIFILNQIEIKKESYTYLGFLAIISSFLINVFYISIISVFEKDARIILKEYSEKFYYIFKKHLLKYNRN